jgi:hypothetical protein
MVVDDLETTCRWFQHLVGPDLKFWLSPAFMGGDKAYADLTDTPGQFRIAMALIPGSPVVMEFIEYKDHAKNYVRPHIQDPGTAHILFMSRDVDIVMPRMRTAGLQTLSATDEPVFIGPTTRSFFVTNPDGFWANHGSWREKILTSTIGYAAFADITPAALSHRFRIGMRVYSGSVLPLNRS